MRSPERLSVLCLRGVAFWLRGVRSSSPARNGVISCVGFFPFILLLWWLPEFSGSAVSMGLGWSAERHMVCGGLLPPPVLYWAICFPLFAVYLRSFSVYATVLLCPLFPLPVFFVISNGRGWFEERTSSSENMRFFYFVLGSCCVTGSCELT